MTTVDSHYSHHFEGEPFPDPSAPRAVHVCNLKCHIVWAVTTVDDREERGLRLIAPVPAHDADCEADFGSQGWTPCRCEERERDYLDQDDAFRRSRDV